jgi:hypothetical protein
MKKLILSLFAFAAFAAAQSNFISQTSLTAAMTATQNYALVASATGLATTRVIKVDDELMTIKTTYNGSALNVPVTRDGAKKSAHISGAMVLGGRPDWFQTYDPFGACTAAAQYAYPWVNTSNGHEWLCGLLNTWIPGFQNTSTAQGISPAVASAAGLITPSGPLFHVTGALAVTGFNIPLGFSKGSFCVIPDGTFTTTNANNIAIASTAVVSKQLCFTYDANTSKFYPSY